jgi:cytoskeleton protein RodZ
VSRRPSTGDFLMSELSDTQPLKPAATTAGGLLRQARQAQGLHIAALAAAIKVTPRKLELLEGDRLDELPDATFTRALAQTVCRTLKIDAAPVLALLPPPRGPRLEQVSEGLNAPFRENSGRLDAADWLANLLRPAVWAPALVLLAAAGLYLAPAGLFRMPSWATAVPASADAGASAAANTVAPGTVPAVVAPATPAVAATAPEPAASAMVETVFSAPQEAPSAASSPSATAPPMAGLLQVRTTAESWIEVLDGRWQPLMSRMVQPGEAVGLDGARPFRLKIGNAAVTQVVFRGQPVELAAYTRDNVAKLELK